MIKALNAQSIAARLFLSAAFWSSTILVVAGLGLTAVHARSTEAAFDEQLGVYLKALVANVASNGEEGLSGPGQFIGPAVRTGALGLVLADHAARRASRPTSRASRSLFAAQLPRLDAAPARRPESGAVRSGYVTGPDERSLRMIERVIDAGDEGRYLIQVAGNSEEIEAEIDDFEYALGGDLRAAARRHSRLDGAGRPLRASPAAASCRKASPRSGAARPSISAAISRRTFRRSPPRSTCCSTPIARSSIARARRSAISRMR